ncbi:hypothetical protein COE01_21675 [Bacillus thuringiensis]|uniref:hypothetical protein n=1 Tax=Bacillus thuringiensis TaxID=1428 RepID=UPI000BFEA3A8|nr:hypothetical protein [Bacillus thuringiensis]PGW77541.1 hypothetical protein COE01_21675 [Bacillus thuringiensis]
MKTYIIYNLSVKGLDEEIKFDKGYLYVHESNYINWNIDIDGAEQVSVFRNAIRNREYLALSIFTSNKNYFKGTVMVKNITNDSIELKGSGELLGYVEE